jgi:hypothetical protein
MLFGGQTPPIDGDKLIKKKAKKNITTATTNSAIPMRKFMLAIFV